MSRQSEFKKELLELFKKYRMCCEIGVEENNTIVLYSFSKFDDEDNQIEEPIYLEFQDTITIRKLQDDDS